MHSNKWSYKKVRKALKLLKFLPRIGNEFEVVTVSFEQVRLGSVSSTLKVWTEKNATSLKYGHYEKIYNSCAIIMKLCQSNPHMS